MTEIFKLNMLAEFIRNREVDPAVCAWRLIPVRNAMRKHYPDAQIMTHLDGVGIKPLLQFGTPAIQGAIYYAIN